MAAKENRLEREKKTVELMIGLYCRRVHHTRDGLCPDCRKLLDYAFRRIEHCRFGSEKPTCANCSVHCYSPQMREQIRFVMRYSGPRMALRHPLIAWRHLRDGRRHPVHGNGRPKS
ncbi:ygba ecs3588 cytoplasmic uvra stm2860 amidophosphoribosyltransferase vva0912 so0324 vpa0976 cpe0229 [Acididesulfobacillus acetoxydans]|uniref:Nitrous oxide-stimulated promoter n=1 Tax=Acididesulfobacillus acetoxydans TaxID=1561005 RepID=A0A8S0X5G4_9FIRM|nr:nitrous oxide-stimulated promoter family protein [Acididesulfobacillus acetoxydans]CAA7601620.1 ygba ecs3588 cytoplasmic uvra stm2860 amidophosphoribosyltransferase vva0912 so0324 vpa0976 cpe0229 [Acididesulfobacillus acetoxydans]CEJ07107.1 Nitrous oxide-stimulated promoter [Acididesulfobacillus acetoxydans]